MNNADLFKISRKHGTDKVPHGFTTFYSNLFEHRRFDPLNVLEIGVLNGSSIRTWEEYFPNSMIYGVDIEDKARFNTQRIITTIADQEKYEEIKSVFPGVMFDIIVEDGGHTMLQQQTTLKALFDRLNTGGIFIMEDLHTSVLACTKKPINRWVSANDKKTTMDLVEAIAKHEDSLDDYHISKDQIKAIQSQTNSVQILYNNNAHSITAAIIKK
jgi:hypothetical protein